MKEKGAFKSYFIMIEKNKLDSKLQLLKNKRLIKTGLNFPTLLL